GGRRAIVENKKLKRAGGVFIFCLSLIPVEILNLDGYCEPGKAFQETQRCDWILFSINGLRFFKKTGIELVNPAPHFLLGTRGMLINSEFRTNRENWVIQFGSDPFRLSSRPGWVELQSDSKWVSIPCITYVDPAEVPGWQHEFRLLLEMMAEPLPRNLLRL